MSSDPASARPSPFIHASSTVSPRYRRGPAQRQAQRSGHRRFGPAGIRRPVPSRVARRRDPCAARSLSRDRRDQEGGDPRRDRVDGVVQPGGELAEALVPGVAVTDHAVQGVDRLAGAEARQAENREPQDRRGHAVGKVLRRGLDRGARDAVLVERLGIASDDVGDR